MATGLVLNELDLNLSAFSSPLLVIIVVIVSCHGCSWSFGSSGVDTIASEVVAGRGVVKAARRIGDVCHVVFLWGDSSLTMST